RYLGLHYGKHHNFPAIGTTGNSKSFDTTNDTLVVWVLEQQRRNQTIECGALAYDRANTTCVYGRTDNYQFLRPNTYIAGIQLDNFPRRERNFFLRFFTWGDGKLIPGHLVIANPLYGEPFPEWKAEPLPRTDVDGNLEVTLDHSVSGALRPDILRNVPTDDPLNRKARFGLTIRQNGQPSTNWRVTGVEISDATGNCLRSIVSPYDGAAQDVYAQPLWPDEPWKIRLELSKFSSFDADETWTVTNVPVIRGNQRDVWNYWTNSSAFAETLAHGIQLKAFPAARLTNHNGGTNIEVQFHMDPPPEHESARFQLLTATDDQGRSLGSPNHRENGGDYYFTFPNTPDTHTWNFTVALHKSRVFEFTAAPTRQ
ncbi:MAG TPA: hypothetical protein VN625_11350, partial [Desulfuromonadaceae bacterium]|nr:hypothetical protein [Desulfuromonadaceae bacterium]